jgi:hypothetical protein
MALFDFLSSTPATPPTQSSTFAPPTQATNLINAALPGAQAWAETPIQRFQGPTVAGADPLQTQGQEMVLGATGQQQSLANSGVNASNYWLNPGVLDVNNDPYVRSAIDASTRPILDNFTMATRPENRSAQIGGGTFGGSRGEITDRLALEAMSRAAGDTASKVALSARGQAIDAQGRALGLLPQTQQATLAPGTTTSGVGDVRQGQQQRELGAEIDAFNFDQWAPILQAQEAVNLANAIPGGTNVATGAVAPEASAASRALGGALSGAAAGTAFGPWGTVIGGVAGGVAPFLFG